MADKVAVKKTINRKVVAQKKPLKKTRPKQDGIKSLLGEIKRVPLSELKVHPRNPREGDIASIAESLEENGQYRRLVVQKDTSYILAGNHTFLAARSLGWKYIDVEVIDVDDDEAETILLADNATGQRGGFNEALLAEILAKRTSIKGTGYDQDEANAIVERNRERLRDTMENLAEREEQERAAIEEAKDAARFDHVPLGEEEASGVIPVVDADDDEADEELPGRLEKAKEDLTGAFQLKDDMAFDGVGVWGLPKIRQDMLMTWDDLPEKLAAWAGSATKDWPDDDQWWLYNFGIDSTSGMRDPSKMILSFYAFDQYFENWWYYPAKYVTKLLNTGIKYALMPDFSMHTPGEESRVMSLWSLYRNRWLARYFQEAGIKIVPNITWATKDEEFLKRHILSTLPKRIPLLAIQIQTVDEKADGHDEYVKQLQYILDTLKPDALLLYYGKAGKRIFDDGLVKYNGEIKWVASRMHALSAQAAKRTKKKGL